MTSLKQLISLVIAIATFAYTFYSMGKLIMFLSAPTKVRKEYVWVLNLLDNKSRLQTAFVAILLDTAYIIVFILQHSVMKSQIVKSIIYKVGLGVAERAIYSLTSAICLLYLIDNWRPAPTIILWQVDVANSNALYWTFILIHALAWIIIYGGSIIMDLPEIVGIKQVYYDMKNYAPPMAYKSFELKHLYGHVRHPSFIGLTAVLWVTNLMSIDRLVLASLLTLYMYVAWSTDHNDVIYQKCQLTRKQTELKHQRY